MGMGDCAIAPTAFLSGLALSALLTPLARRVATAANLVAPVRADRLHREARPYGGGIAIMLAVVVGLAAQLLIAPGAEDEKISQDFHLWGRLALGAGLFFVLGLMDDRYAFPAWPKLLLQFACAAVVVLGLGLKSTVFLRVHYAPEAVSVLWILVVVNAYNMLDHADGVAAAVGAVALAWLSAGQMVLAAGLSSDHGVITVIPEPALAAAGALAGFLVYNRPPAQLFMGDAGSMFVGYLLAALTMETRYYYALEGMSKFVVLIPLAVLAVPLFDMVCVILARLRRGASPMKGDATSHLAHRMLARGWSPRGIAAFAAAASAVTGGASVAMYFVSGSLLLIPWLAIATVLAAMLAVRRPPRTREESAPQGA
jgi:UDP-GlcNAc:undecaprenyl-phosphate GlcNAc-1-phosphate transferase